MYDLECVMKVFYKKCLVLQMVWEQGCVVIVLLTKLTENGEAKCHRYWPDEGSDLYHIYEVIDFKT